jgi:hypothetical protein
MMITVADLEQDAKNLVGRFAQVDRVALNALDIVMGNPEGAEVLSIASSLVGLNLPPGVITGWAAAGKAILSLFPPAPSTSPAAAAALAA